jgi:hypothetical protein
MQQEHQYEERLLANVRAMSDKDRAWILALSDRRRQPNHQTVGEAYLVVKYSTPGE